MRQEFNPLWFIPSSTYLSKFFSVIESHYPDNGQMATMYVKTENLADHLSHLDQLISNVKNETGIISRVDDWFTGFKEFSTKHHAVGTIKCNEKLLSLILIFLNFLDWTKSNLTDTEFHTYLKNYLFSQKGAKFRANFKFSHPLECRSSLAPNISV